MKITFDLLQVIDAIDRHGSFTAAAAALHRVPSALSHAVAKLEDELGVTLFERVGRRAVLNEAGRTLLDDGRHLLRTASDLLLGGGRGSHENRAGDAPGSRIAIQVGRGLIDFIGCRRRAIDIAGDDRLPA